MRVLRHFALPRPRFNLPASHTADRFVADELVFELIRIALLEVFETEVGPEESCGPVLQSNAPLAFESRSPHPLVGRTLRMIDDEQSDALNFRRRCKSQHGLAVAVSADAIEHPALFRYFGLRIDDLQGSFISLRLGVGSTLRFFDDLSRIRLRVEERQWQIGRAHV